MGILPVPGGVENATSANSLGKEGDEYEGLSACFPAHARVTLFDGTKKNMTELRVGDLVSVGSTGSEGESSAIFMFTHADATREYGFVEMTASSGQKLTLSPGHILYSNDMRPTPAQDVRLGDVLYVSTQDGMKSTTVEAIRHILATGLFNPQTLHGDIIVDDFLTTTYTTAIQPHYAHQLLAPLRTLYRMGIHTGLFDLQYGSEPFLKLWGSRPRYLFTDET